MGLLKDAFGPAFGAGQVNNGMNGPLSTFKKGVSGNNSSASSMDSPYAAPQYRNSAPQLQQQQYRTLDPRLLQPHYQSQDSQRGQRQQRNGGSRRDRRQQRSAEPRRRQRDRRSGGYQDQGNYDDYAYSDEPAPPEYGAPYGAPYGAQMGGYASIGSQSEDVRYGRPRSQFDDYSLYGDDTYSQPLQPMNRTRSPGFRPLALPQVAYGEGKPFLRGYSNELMLYGVSETEFIRIIDSLNAAIIPNPEAQIFEKAASIAGHFVPGADAIGIMASRIAVGLASGIGHGSMLGKTLSEANLGLFIPNGLEICLGKGQNVDQEAGVPSSSQGFQGAVDPWRKLAQYDDYLMPISVVYPEQKKAGRQDPIAMMGQGMSAKDAERQMQRAEKERDRGRTRKGDSLEGSLQWLIVRKASPDSTVQWQKTLRHSEAALAEEQAQADGGSRR